MSSPELSRQLDPTVNGADRGQGKALEFVAERRFDQALGQFIIAQGLVPPHHLNEYWSTGIYQNQRLSEALLQYQMIPLETLQTVLQQFESRYLTCSRCHVSMEGKRNHFPRCPSCQSDWFEDGGLPQVRTADDAVDVKAVGGLASPRLQISDEGRRQNEDVEIDDESRDLDWKHGTFLIGIFLLGLTILYGLGRLRHSRNEMDFLFRIYSGRMCEIVVFLLLVKGFAKLLGANVRLFTLFIGYLTSYLAMWNFGLTALPFVSLAWLKMWADAWNWRTEAPVGYGKASLFFVILNLLASFLLIYVYVMFGNPRSWH